ncbi:MAG TPA: anaerobic nitric oxide reductase flavorubredoxin [Thermoclostridium caenicola]|nr:anaerobic nitric oxide reductase flavorubredoxin [Thermoclostridium caenicola]
MKKLIKNNVYWVGKVDWELKTFHGSDYSVNHGSSQNAYLIQEEKTVLIDTVWKPHADEFVDNLAKEVDLNKIDFIVINHGEVDHSGALPALMERIPNTPIYCTANAVKSLTGQYHHPEWNFRVVKTGDSVDIGNGKKLIFVEMRMLHWPDSMATYMTGDNILFSNDAFGQHYAVEELFNDKADPCELWEEAMKYYANILTPYSPLVKKKIEEIQAFNLPIDIIATSHGVIWRENPLQIVEKYYAWAQDYQEDQITIVYDTMWEGTLQLANQIGREISRISPDTRVKVFNISKYDKNDIMTEVFRSRAIAVGSPTVGNGILSSVGGWLDFLKELKFKNKKAAVFGCYGWSGESTRILRERLTDAGFQVVEPEIRCNWNPTEEDLGKAADIAKALCE